MSELQQSTYLVGGVADYGATVQGLDELWRVYYDRGDVSYRAAQQTTPSGPQNHVDGSEAIINELTTGPSDIVEYGLELSATGEPEVYALLTTGERIVVCWKCSGIGHVKKDCPSQRRTSPAEAIQLLSQIANSSSERSGRGFLRSRGGGRFGGRGWRGGRGRGRGSGMMAMVLDDGSVIDPGSGGGCPDMELCDLSPPP